MTVRNGPNKGDPTFIVFLKKKKVSSSFFLYFFLRCCIAGISIRRLPVDVPSVVVAVWRCGVLKTQAGIAGIGLGHQIGREREREHE